MNIAIVTDSTCDIPEELAAQNNICIVPNTIVIDGKGYEDGKDISRQEFYERLPHLKSLPTTASASSGAYQLLYDQLFAQGFQHIISIHASSLLSGIFNAASVAAQPFVGRVHVIDSGQVTLGLGFQVLEVSQVVAPSPVGRGASLEVALQFLSDVSRRARVVAMLDTLEYIRRSGRVSWVRARLGEMLRIKPIIEVKAGKVLSLGEARTYRKGVDRLLEILHNLGSLERLAILHTNAEAEARQLLARYDRPVSSEPLLVNVTTVIGTHVGPCGLGIAAIVK